jgi:protein-S-isoprenylcysteine O-methyltransferase Ste14
MNRSKPFSLVAAVILLVVAAAHLLRIVDGWQVTIADSLIPMWVSWLGMLLAGFVGTMLLREARR